MNEAEVDELLRLLRLDADRACWDVGILKSVIDNQGFADRVNGSESGRVAIVAIDSIRVSLILYLARVWEEGADRVSLPRVYDCLPEIEELERRRANRLASLGISGVPAPIKDRLDDFVEAFEIAKNSKFHPYLRLMRTEHYAHRLRGSREREKFERSNQSIEQITHDELISLSEQTLTLVGKLGYMWDQLADPYTDRVRWVENRSVEFWHLMPVFRLMERLND